MDNDDSAPSEPLDLRDLSPQDAPTINQLVAYNMTRARRSRGWTQQEVADRLEKYTGRPWSKASISAAERAWQGGRPRKFDANELVALSVIFETPVAYFLLPMQEGNKAVVMAQPEDQKPDGFHWIGVGLLLKRVLMDEITSRGGTEFFVRAHDAALRYLDADWHAPKFPEKPPPFSDYPPGYRFGDPLEEEGVDWEEVQENAEKARREQAAIAHRVLTDEQQHAFLQENADELALKVAQKLAQMGVIKRDPSDVWNGDPDAPPPF